MKITKAALVLQGGAVRAAFTAGVLDVFMEKELEFDYIVGVSAGALIALSYLSKQPGRSRSVVIDAMSDKNFVNRRFLLTKKSLFNFDYLFGEMSDSVLPFDRDTYLQSTTHLIVGTTSCLSGQPVYFDKATSKEFFKAIAASSSLPFLSAPVMVEGEPYLDGGLASPIPFRKALEDGYKKMIVITTRDKTYRKDIEKKQHETFLKALYGKYPKLISTVLAYPQAYNTDATDLETLENEKGAFVIRPEQPIVLKRTEKDKEKLGEVYNAGRKTAEEIFLKLVEYLKNE
ncbi:MAG: patatin family protein [Bacteroidia bacterium]|nr:patatin family protein [Bacteroidia bacterium]